MLKQQWFAPKKQTPHGASALIVALLISYPTQVWALRLSITCSPTHIAPLANSPHQQSIFPLAIDLDFDGRVDSLSFTSTSEGQYFALNLASGSIFPLATCERGGCPMNSLGGLRTPHSRYLITTTDHEGGEDESIERYRFYRYTQSRLLLAATLTARHPHAENRTRLIFVPTRGGSVIAIYGRSAVQLRFHTGHCDVRSTQLANIWRRFPPQWSSVNPAQDCRVVLRRAHRLLSLGEEGLSTSGPLLPAGTHVFLRSDEESLPSPHARAYRGAVATEGILQGGYVDLVGSEVPPRCLPFSQVSR